MFDNDRVISFQNSFFRETNKYKDDFERYEKCEQEMTKAFKDAVTIEISTCSKKVADNILSALKNDECVYYDGIGYNHFGIDEQRISIETYDESGKTYYRIKYCLLDNIDKDTRFLLRYLRDLNLSFTIPISRLVEEDWSDKQVLVGVPYEFYDKNDYYNQSSTNSDYFLNVADIENTFRKNSLKGDVNVDGEVDYRDISLLRDYLLNKSSFAFSAEHFNVYGADINDDNSIDIFDMSLLRGLI